ncbi:hypothetical protein P7K49_012104 [Saguinus oedipus]|uniref:Uncharacterized protein n=1 Tax=Saguinus oedipus TaxID=9490 RepID=A0ABQ9VW29_SAGOE|nr:hypothetical protein P7K49_012104 [Saguinus oedipus]
MRPVVAGAGTWFPGRAPGGKSLERGTRTSAASRARRAKLERRLRRRREAGAGSEAAAGSARPLGRQAAAVRDSSPEAGVATMAESIVSAAAGRERGRRDEAADLPAAACGGGGPAGPATGSLSPFSPGLSQQRLGLPRRLSPPRLLPVPVPSRRTRDLGSPPWAGKGLGFLQGDLTVPKRNRPPSSPGSRLQETYWSGSRDSQLVLPLSEPGPLLTPISLQFSSTALPLPSKCLVMNH